MVIVVGLAFPERHADGGADAAEQPRRGGEALALDPLAMSDDGDGLAPSLPGDVDSGGGDLVADAPAGACHALSEVSAACYEFRPAVAADAPHGRAVLVVVGELEYRQASEALAGDVLYFLGYLGVHACSIAWKILYMTSGTIALP